MLKLAIKAELQTLLPIKRILPSSSSGIRDRKESDVRFDPNTRTTFDAVAALTCH